MLFLSAIGLIVPAVFHRLSRRTCPESARARARHRDRRRAVRHVCLEPRVHLEDAPAALRPDAARSCRRTSAGAGAEPRLYGCRQRCCSARPSASRSSANAGGSRHRRRAETLGMSQLFVGIVIVGHRRQCGGALLGCHAGRRKPRWTRPQHRDRIVRRRSRLLRCAPARVPELPRRPAPMDLVFTAFELVAVGRRGVEHRVHRARWRDPLDGRRPAAGGLCDPRARLLLPPMRSSVDSIWTTCSKLDNFQLISELDLAA